MFVYNSWSKINTIGKLAPEDRTLYASTCDQSLSLGKAGYCQDFKEVKIGSEKQFMNCDFLNSQFGLGIDDASVDCAKSPSFEQDYCSFLTSTKVITDKVYKIVNGQNCSIKGFNPVDAVATK